MNPSYLEFLRLLVAANGDMESAKATYEANVTADMIREAGGGEKPLSEDLVDSIKATAAKRTKAMLPAIGNSLIEYGRGLGGKTRVKKDDSQVPYSVDGSYPKQ